MEGMEGSSGSGFSGCRYNLRSKTKKNSPPLDPESSPTHKRTKEDEAIAVKVAEYIAQPRKADYPGKNTASYEKQCRDCVETALMFLNKSKKSQKLGGYEVVKVMGVMSFKYGKKGLWCHTCFKAKPKNSPDAEARSFFAELKYLPPRPFKCIRCYKLQSLEFGYHGCQACRSSRLRVDHPMREFRIGLVPFTLDGCSPLRKPSVSACAASLPS